MAHEEAVSNQHSAVSQEALSSQHSAISEDQNLSQNQNQNQNQKRFTAKDAEDAEESKQNQQRRSTTEDTEATEGGKTLPLIHGKTGQVNADEQARVQQRAEALALKLAQTYEELTRLLERNPGMKRQFTEGEAKEDRVYQRLKQRLKMADMAPRCQWVRQDGTTCGSPQLKQHIYCFAHRQMAEARTLMLMLPAMEDANAIQIGIMRIQKALIEGTISTKMAGLLLYSMQLALQNVGQTTFGQAKDEEMVRETVDEDQALSDQQSAVSENQHQNQRPFTAEGAQPPQQAKTGLAGGPGHAKDCKQNQHQNQRPFTTEDTEKIGASGHRVIGTSENQNLPRMDADERGLKVGSRPVEWNPTPDMYRMDTREGMEAYEANFRMKITTSGDRVIGRSAAREATPPRAAVPHEPWDPTRIAEPYANQG
jgi:hypothetical protein